MIGISALKRGDSREDTFLLCIPTVTAYILDILSMQVGLFIVFVLTSDLG